MSAFLRLADHGQALWLDYIDRNLVVNGGLKELVHAGLRGVTSNPTIFHKAISSTPEYDEQIRDLLQADHDIDRLGLYHWLTLQDIQIAADILRPVYDSTKGKDGYVSMEVPPALAYDTEATVHSAHDLWRGINRPNLMIKVPATLEGLPAIERLTAEGINVNATLLFSVERYQKVLSAYLRGASANPHPERIASVASFFVSRIDKKVDQALERIGSPQALALRGRIAIANAKLAYQHFKQSRWPDKVPPQRLLWGSTSTKNPAYSDVMYVEGLIGPDTVNTVPPETLDAFLQHGEIGHTLEADLDIAQRDIDALKPVGIDLDEITQQLEREGVAAFADSYDQLLAALDEKRSAVAKDYAGR